ncbi:glycoside hydrolase family 127 protein [Streptacidiphilus carbonis]|uniref:glycoside hydrolase family 127 protein n=1 Tax=Streptacidiphilus carbonis TaxID=105422 RepID=UPI0005A912E4|nr:beta-L-arabinofuranosidase domain-containing protein [Streptacidiphilus carbonis]
MAVPDLSTQTTPGPLRLSGTARTALRPAPGAQVVGGFWHERRRINAEASIPQGPGLLETAGNLHNLRLAAGTAEGSFRGDYPFVDSDVYKWLEAASWRLAGIGPGEGGPAVVRLADDVARIIDLVAGAQQPDGYLNTWFQLTKGGARYTDLSWGHELYCAGHLIQAAVAHHRATGQTSLLTIAGRFADHLVSAFGPGPDRGIDGIDGHPEIETALVELFRETGERRYLELAGYFLDRRGHGLLGGGAYWQDRVPLRRAAAVEGHAVRQLYLLAGAADLAAETGDRELHAANERLWEEMAAGKTYLTGGLGAHHDKESFGDPFELPTERAYCETCAAVASVQWNWRMALLTGRARYSDLVERTLFNGFLSGVGLDGRSWLYVNPLQVRDGHTDPGGDKSARRTRWFRCACCPPNAMRLLASLPHYLSSTDGEGLQLHQYASGRFSGEAGGPPVVVNVNTDYPWRGRIEITVEEAPEDREWTLSLRIPHWCRSHSVRLGGQRLPAPAEAGWVRLRRTWRTGEQVVLELDLTPRLTEADPRVDAVRGCVAIECGPLVYCLEEADHQGGGLDRVVLDRTAPLSAEHRPDLLGGVTVITASGRRRPEGGAADWWPYRTAEPVADPAAGSRAAEDEPAADKPAADRAAADDAGQRLELTAVPYYAWANREDGGMRVWLPTR